ncbi:MAG: (Fe-S)-binding protein [Saprospiraceae bacterium]|nr:(Fe-S)-binding protein [Saprospiraceae bacterium]
MNVITMSEFANNGQSPEILFWVGCAGSFDARAQKVTKAFCEILNHAKISFAILGNEEKCTGDPARRAGNEFLFQMTALQNIQTLNMYAIKKIVTACPHCFNTLKNEYPELGGNYYVVHHTQYLETHLSEVKIKFDEQSDTQTVTYHDSCYLGRANNIIDSPREVLSKLKLDLKELKRSKLNGLCCGAGGAQMFKEDEPGNKRINTERAEEIIENGSKIVTANCPFCLTMLQDGIKEKNQQDNIMVYDLAELVLNKIVK